MAVETGALRSALIVVAVAALCRTAGGALMAIVGALRQATRKA
jgi:hypothetical protein